MVNPNGESSATAYFGTEDADVPHGTNLYAALFSACPASAGLIGERW